jgi:hypothetical protein
MEVRHVGNDGSDGSASNELRQSSKNMQARIRTPLQVGTCNLLVLIVVVRTVRCGQAGNENSNRALWTKAEAFVVEVRFMGFRSCKFATWWPTSFTAEEFRRYTTMELIATHE